MNSKWGHNKDRNLLQIHYLTLPIENFIVKRYNLSILNAQSVFFTNHLQKSTHFIDDLFVHLLEINSFLRYSILCAACVHKAVNSFEFSLKFLRRNIWPHLLNSIAQLVLIAGMLQAALEHQ